MHKTEPFHPFEIHLADGRSLSVPHPEYLWINPPGRTIVVALKDGTFEIVDLLLVTSLRLHANGRSRRRT